MRKLRWIALIVTHGLIGGTCLAQDAGGVQLRVVRYDGLKEEVIRHRGKVVLVDFWGEFCLPCKKGMPHVQQLHRQYGKDGLVVITVSVDDLRQGNANEIQGRVLGFLRQQGATTINLLLDDHPVVRMEKLRLKTVPCYYIFNRQGKWTQFGGDSPERVDYAVIDRLIVDLLREP